MRQKPADGRYASRSAKIVPVGKRRFDAGSAATARNRKPRAAGRPGAQAAGAPRRRARRGAAAPARTGRCAARAAGSPRPTRPRTAAAETPGVPGTRRRGRRRSRRASSGGSFARGFSSSKIPEPAAFSGPPRTAARARAERRAGSPPIPRTTGGPGGRPSRSRARGRRSARQARQSSRSAGADGRALLGQDGERRTGGAPATTRATACPRRSANRRPRSR